MTEVPRVLFVSSADWTGISRLPRYVRLSGGSVSVLTNPGFKLSVSSFVSERFPAAGDADKTLDLLRRHLESGRRYNWIVLGDDVLLGRAVERLDESWLSPLLPVRANDRDAARVLVSKCAFARAMSACGVLMPPGQDARGIAEVRAAAAAVGFPVLAKPDRGFGGNSIISAGSDEELAARADGAAPALFRVERRIEGRLCGTPVLFDRGKPAWWSSFAKDGVWPEPFGASCRRLELEPPGIEETLGRIGAALGLHGLFGVDTMLARDGRLFVIELNGRPIPMVEGSPQVARALPEALRDFLAGRPAVRRPSPAPEAVLWHAMPYSFELACSRRDWLQAAGLLCGLGYRTDAPWGDWGLLKRHAHEIREGMMNVLRASKLAPSRVTWRSRPRAPRR